MLPGKQCQNHRCCFPFPPAMVIIRSLPTVRLRAEAKGAARITDASRRISPAPALSARCETLFTAVIQSALDSIQTGCSAKWEDECSIQGGVIRCSRDAAVLVTINRSAAPRIHGSSARERLPVAYLFHLRRRFYSRYPLISFLAPTFLRKSYGMNAAYIRFFAACVSCHQLLSLSHRHRH